MKHYIKFCALALLVFALAGCQKKQAEKYDGVTVRLLTDGTGIDDKSFNAAAWRGILSFYGDTWDKQSKRGAAYDVIIVQSEDAFIPAIRQATDGGYDLIVATGFIFKDALLEVARDNPQQKYMLVDESGLEPANILQAVYAEHEGSYLAGAAAALKALEDGIVNPRFGFIGGMAYPVITKFEVGYIQGILSVIPNAQIVDYYVGSWGEPALAKTQAKGWYDSGVYAIYSAAGSSGGGTIAQAKEYRAAGKNVWAIGVDSDQHSEGIYNGTDSAVLTSMIKKVENSLLYGLKAVKDGAFDGGELVFDLKVDGVGFSTTNPALGASIPLRLEEIRQRIISGDIYIAPTYAEAKTIPGFPANLKALD